MTPGPGGRAAEPLAGLQPGHLPDQQAAARRRRGGAPRAVTPGLLRHLGRHAEPGVQLRQRLQDARRPALVSDHPRRGGGGPGAAAAEPAPPAGARRAGRRQRAARCDGRAPGPAAVPPGEGRLEIRFTALSYLAPRKVRFSYRLEGFDEELERARDAARGHVHEPPAGPLHVPGQGLQQRRGLERGRGVVPAVPAAALLPDGLVLRALRRARWCGRSGGSTCSASQRMVEMERVRTRIAADLHDDIGAGLSQIAVLSEVARAAAAPATAPRARGLAGPDRGDRGRAGGLHERHRLGREPAEGPAGGPRAPHARLRQRRGGRPRRGQSLPGRGPGPATGWAPTSGATST